MILATAIAAVLLAAPGDTGVVFDAARNKEAGRAARQERETFVNGLPRGATFRSARQTYQMAGNVRAVGASARQAPEQVLAAAGLGASDLVERKGRFLVVRESGALSQALQVGASGSTTHPVAVNRATGGLGVVTGVITVRLRSVASAVALASDHGLELVSTATGIKAAFYRVPVNQDIAAAGAALARDRRVRSAEIEVQEAVRELH